MVSRRRAQRGRLIQQGTGNPAVFASFGWTLAPGLPARQRSSRRSGLTVPESKYLISAERDDYILRHDGRLTSVTAPNPSTGGSGGPVTNYAYNVDDLVTTVDNSGTPNVPHVVLALSFNHLLRAAGRNGSGLRQHEAGGSLGRSGSSIACDPLPEKFPFTGCKSPLRD